MLNIAVCDDEKFIVGQIETMILDICADKIKVDIDAFYSGSELEKEILNGTRYDLIYLDIQMSNGDGISTAQSIRKRDENALLIFISGYDKYMMKLFRMNVFAFIKKPINKTTFNQIFSEANNKICNSNFYFTFRYKSCDFKILCKEILYFESRGRQIKIHCRDGKIEIFNGKLSEVETKVALGKIPFLRIHQSYLVNYHLIKSKNKVEVRLIDNTTLPISEDRQKEFNQEYGKLLGEEIDV